MGPGDLQDVLSGLTRHEHTDLLVGLGRSDDAAVYRITDELAIVNSGLEDTMIVAYQDIREALRRQPTQEVARPEERRDTDTEEHRQGRAAYESGA